MSAKLIAPIIVLSLAMAACGGGGGSRDADAGIVYTGSRSPASVDAANASALAIAAAGGTSQAIAADTAHNANPILPRGAATNTNLVTIIVTQLQNLALASNRIANLSLPLCDSGSADLEQNSDGTRGTIVFTQCELADGDGAIVDGRVEFSATFGLSTITSLDLRFVDFTVGYLGETHAVDLVVSCVGEPLACELMSDFVGLDGRIYRIEITAVTNTGGTAFEVDATVFDPDHGFVTIDASVVYNHCPGGVPQSGAIVISGAGATGASVMFNDCDSFTVIHMLDATVYSWADIL